MHARRSVSPFGVVFLFTVACSFAVYERPPLPRINVRWAEVVTQPEREAVAAKYHLTAANVNSEGTWSYALVDASKDNISRLVGDPAIEDTSGIDRAGFELDDPPPSPLFHLIRFLTRSSLFGLAIASLVAWQAPVLSAFFVTHRQRALKSLGRLDIGTRRHRLRTSIGEAATRRLFKWIALGISTLLALVLGEAMARTYDKYSELRPRESRRFLDYESTWREGGLGPGGFLKENFSAYVNDGYGGGVWWQNNSQGFRNTKEFTKTKDKGVVRILSMGDSFTAGYRVGQNDTFSALLERWSTEAIAPTEVLVSCIENPSVGLTYLKDFGLQWHPDLVLLGVTLGNDISEDYVSREDSIHGFTVELKDYDLPDYTLTERRPARGAAAAEFLRRHSRFYAKVTDVISPRGYAPGPWYGDSLKPKMFDPIHGLGFFIRDPPKPIADAFDRHLEVLRDYRDYLKARNTDLAVLLFPQRFQVQSRDWAATESLYSLNADAFDLMNPNKVIARFCLESGIVCIDPTLEMKRMHDDTGVDFYLQRGDMHWNRDGHKAWFEAARQQLGAVIRGRRTS
jgi:hypothetical protein